MRLSGRQSSPTAAAVADPAGAERRERAQRRALRADVLDRAGDRRGGGGQDRRRARCAARGRADRIRPRRRAWIAGAIAARSSSSRRGTRTTMPPGCRSCRVPAPALAAGIASRSAAAASSPRSSAGCVFGALHAAADACRVTSSRRGASMLGAITFIVFGAVMLGPALEERDGRVVATRSSASPSSGCSRSRSRCSEPVRGDPTVGFLGWFGPRGLASVVFARDARGGQRPSARGDAPRRGRGHRRLSVLAAGLTAAPLTERYAGWFAAHPRDRVAAEAGTAPEIPGPRERSPAGSSSRSRRLELVPRAGVEVDVGGRRARRTASRARRRSPATTFSSASGAAVTKISTAPRSGPAASASAAPSPTSEPTRSQRPRTSSALRRSAPRPGHLRARPSARAATTEWRARSRPE